MASAAKHIIQLVGAEVKEKAEGEEAAASNQSPPIPIIPAGALIQFLVQATCSDMPAEATVKAYGFTPPPFIDSTGYRLIRQETIAPTDISNLPGPQNPVTFFNIGVPGSTQTASAAATAFLEPCGTFDASGSAAFSVAPLSATSLDFFDYTVLEKFVVTLELDFGFGNKNGDPGFKIRATNMFLQDGYFGMIQLFKGCQQYQLEGWPVDQWQSIIEETDYVLDVQPDQEDHIGQRVQCQAGRLAVLNFDDAPTIDIGGLILNPPTKTVVAVRQTCQFQSYFLFNPSTSDDPNADPNSMWYPVGHVIGWQISGQATWNPQKGKRTNPDAWTPEDLEPAAKQALPVSFPTWSKPVER